MPCAEPTSGQVHGMSGKLPPVLRITDHTSQQQNASIYFETETPEKSPAQHLHGSVLGRATPHAHQPLPPPRSPRLTTVDRGLLPARTAMDLQCDSGPNPGNQDTPP